jgi:hypothetical protein
LVGEKKTARPSKVKGLCELCHKTDYLCRSHLLPAALFRLLRSTTVTPRDPLLITRHSTFQTSRQVAEYLLCVDCEARIRRGGEDWVLAHCYRGAGKFALRDLVLKAKLLDDGAAARIYSSKSNPDIDVASLAFFAASVFWRGAARTWRFQGHELERIALGRYQESFRRYLLGLEPLPNSAAMLVWVSHCDKPSRAVTMPQTHRVDDCHVHSFDIPGIRFDLFVGREVPSFVRLLCVVNGPERPILLSEAPDDILATQVGQVSRTTRLSKKLQAKGKWSWSL